MKYEKYIFKVRLYENNHIDAHPYRYIEVYSGESLYELAEIITEQFDLYFDHSFQFSDRTPYHKKTKELYELFVDDPNVEHSEGAKSVVETKVKQVWKVIYKKMYFLFDYGDSSVFTVELKQKLKSINKYPALIKSKGEPPEQYPNY